MTINNTSIRKLRDDIVNTINQSGMPIEVSRLILSEIMNEVDKQATNEMMREQSMKQEEE